MTEQKPQRRRRGQQNKGGGGKKSTLLIEIDGGEKWFEYEDSNNASQKKLRHAALQPSDSPNDKSLVEEFRRKSDEIYEQEMKIYREKRKRSSTSDDRWVESTIRKGTLKDRIAAMSVLVAQDPIHQRVDGLLQMCCDSSSNTRVAQLAGEALEDLFANTLLPQERKLVSLEQRPLARFNGKKGSSNTLSPRILLLWRFEEIIRDDYNKFIQNYIHRTLHSRTIAADHQRAALRAAASLLRSVPEGESAVLSLIVDQLSNHEIHSTASHALLTTVQQHHPAMQPIVAREVQQLAHTSRNNAAVYNAVTVLMQLRFSRNQDADLAVQLLKTYFRLFEQATHEKMKPKQKDPNPIQHSSTSKLICALLTGIHRAYPYVKDSSVITPHVDALYKLVHTAPNQSARLQALLVLQQLVKNTDRFHRAVYAATEQLVATTKTAGWNLLYKTIKEDSSTTRVCGMIKGTLIQGGLHGKTSATVAATLFLVNAVAPSHVIQPVWKEPSSSTIVWDPVAREPKWSLKDYAALKETKQPTKDDELVAPAWELSLLQHHYHPTVRTFVQGFGNGQYEYDGDPLRDFSVGNFLDKLAYRNPKQRKRDGDAPTGGGVPVNDPSFMENGQAVQDHEEFFHLYFVERAKRKGVLEELEKQRQPDLIPKEDDETDDEEEAFVNSLTAKLLQESAGGVPIDVDDPIDTEGWDDMYDDEDESTKVAAGFLDDTRDTNSEGPLSDDDDEGGPLLSDDEAPQLVTLPTDGVFASADDYEEVIRGARKRGETTESTETGMDDELMEDVDGVVEIPAKKKNKKKKKKARHS